MPGVGAGGTMMWFTCPTKKYLRNSRIFYAFSAYPMNSLFLQPTIQLYTLKPQLKGPQFNGFWKLDQSWCNRSCIFQYKSSKSSRQNLATLDSSHYFKSFQLGTYIGMSYIMSINYYYSLCDVIADITHYRFNFGNYVLSAFSDWPPPLISVKLRYESKLRQVVHQHTGISRQWICISYETGIFAFKC